MAWLKTGTLDLKLIGWNILFHSVIWFCFIFIIINMWSFKILPSLLTELGFWKQATLTTTSLIFIAICSCFDVTDCHYWVLNSLWLTDLWLFNRFWHVPSPTYDTFYVIILNYFSMYNIVNIFLSFRTFILCHRCLLSTIFQSFLR